MSFLSLSSDPRRCLRSFKDCSVGVGRTPTTSSRLDCSSDAGMQGYHISEALLYLLCCIFFFNPGVRKADMIMGCLVRIMWSSGMLLSIPLRRFLVEDKVNISPQRFLRTVPKNYIIGFHSQSDISPKTG